MILLLVASTRPTACAVLIQVHLEAATRAAANKAMTAIPTSPTDAKVLFLAHKNLRNLINLNFPTLYAYRTTKSPLLCIA